MLAVRLLGVGSLVFLGPGMALLARARLPMEWPEHLLFAFAISYSWTFGLSILLPAVGWTVDHAAALTLLLILAVLPWRTLQGRIRGFRPQRDPTSLAGLCLSSAVLVFAAAAWFIEAPMHGDAALDLLSVGRFADGGPISFDNTSIVPRTRPTYLFQPYQLALGTVARWSGTDVIVAFEKVRPLLVLLALTFVHAAIRRLVPTRAHAMAAFAVVLVFVGLDMTTWEARSLFPVVHRGGMAAGLCVPALIVLCLAATRRATPVDERARRLALGLAPVFLLASMCTHALEMYTLLGFVGVAAVVVLTGLDPTGDRRQVWKLAALVAAILAVYLPLHRRALPELMAFEGALKERLVAEFTSSYPDPAAKLAGAPGQEATDLLSGALPGMTSPVIGMPALALTVCIAPASAALLALATVPLALAYASPAGFVALAMATSADSVQEVEAYFALMGLLALSIGLAAAAQGLVTAGASAQSIPARAAAFSLLAIVLLGLWPLGQEAPVAWLLGFVRSQPRTAVLLAALLTVPLLYVAARRRHRTAPAPAYPPLAVVVAALLAVPLAGAGRPPNERISLAAAVRTAAASPSVLDWPAYYPVLAQTILPRLPVPVSIVDEVRRQVPPRQVLLADPRYSCSLAVLADAYCVNPEFVYGQYYLTAQPYQDRYVYSIDGTDEDWHPLFNATWPMDDRERRFLREYAPDYLLTGPEHAALIDRKLDAGGIGRHVQFTRDGYVLYKLTPGRR